MVYFYSGALAILGLLFASVGFQIVFRRSFSFINNFDRLKMRYKAPEAYAVRVGLIEFCIGAAQIILGVISFVLLNETLSLIFLVTTVVALFLAMMINDNLGLK